MAETTSSSEAALMYRVAHAARQLICRGELDPWVALSLVVAPTEALEQASGAASCPTHAQNVQNEAP